MARFDRQNATPSRLVPSILAQDGLSSSFSRARNSTSIPPNSPSSLAEANGLDGTIIQKPHIPLPDPRLLRNLRSVSSVQSDSSDEESPTTSMPAPIVRDSRRWASWVKARAQYARDRSARRSSPEQLETMSQDLASAPEGEQSVDIGPRRKLSAFVKEEELKFQLDERVGTPHLSELLPGDDVPTQPGADELSMSGKIAALEEAEAEVDDEEHPALDPRGKAAA
ncbi:hypothetical protein CC78DRAFT_528767 [Lojkania enalia]|uniref:Uncharacterized protein n=1 Tax=Lojkania enalia TaxID=147567 RepID=A0A9P4NBX5_9PLEO|nr:hypothetical protein CC78DRAFT_528767 [Didymosphaeria enalia]